MIHPDHNVRREADEPGRTVLIGGSGLAADPAAQAAGAGARAPLDHALQHGADLIGRDRVDNLGSASDRDSGDSCPVNARPHSRHRRRWSARIDRLAVAILDVFRSDRDRRVGPRSRRRRRRRSDDRAWSPPPPATQTGSAAGPPRPPSSRCQVHHIVACPPSWARRTVMTLRDSSSPRRRLERSIVFDGCSFRASSVAPLAPAGEADRSRPARSRPG